MLDPSRGADGGKDLVVGEQRVGPLSETRIKWLVSCKHFAHSGRSVTPGDELNVVERVKAAGCDGFLGFYSTLPSTGLQNLVGGQPGIEVCLLDHESIERRLLGSVKGHDVVKRYFPASYTRIKPQPANLYGPVEPICCESCGKDLLEPPSGIWVLWRGEPEAGKVGDHYIDMHFTCKGACDVRVESRVRARRHGAICLRRLG